jgi:hypothetical protein
LEAIRSSETSVHTRSTRRHIPENGILHSHRRENLKSSYLVKLFSTESNDNLFRGFPLASGHTVDGQTRMAKLLVANVPKPEH